MQEESHRLAENLCFGQQCAESLEENVQATGDNNDKRNKQEDADVVKDLAIYGARTLDEPDSIERLFYI